MAVSKDSISGRGQLLDESARNYRGGIIVIVGDIILGFIILINIAYIILWLDANEELKRNEIDSSQTKRDKEIIEIIKMRYERNIREYKDISEFYEIEKHIKYP